MKRTCNFCGNENVVLIAGYDYCIPCSRRVDHAAILNLLIKAFPSITMEIMKDVCTWMFKSKDYYFSNLSSLYPILDRGPWIEKDNRYKINQSEYIVSVFHKQLKEMHPKIFERISHE